MTSLKLTLPVLSILLLLKNSVQQKFPYDLLKEIDGQTKENYVLSVFNIELILYEIYASKAIENNTVLERNFKTGLGGPEETNKLLEWGLKYKNASTATFVMASKVVVPQDQPLAKKLSIISDLLMRSAKRSDVDKDIKVSKDLNSWLAEKVDPIRAAFVELQKNNSKLSNKIAAISGTLVTPLWRPPFKSLLNRYFVKKYGPEYPNMPLCVPMMHSLYSLRTMATDEATGIFIPFSATDIGMLILLPREGVSCQDIIKNLKTQTNKKLSDPRDINLILPIFKVAFEQDIRNALAKTDVGSIFKDSALDSKTNIEIDEFLVKTVVQFKPNNYLAKVEDINTKKADKFEVNRAFVFVIKDKDSIYAVGRVEQLDGLAEKVKCPREYTGKI
ncbi:accessory gland protein Acp76A [Drosophila eugracilis]|uniref:accessory gland protein Acp76A n=1 Tax=Drosophila eugracilis TaxID=29029 RepID=UPI0007E83D76|nr:accessory gland protein Acp76A [Drosophila eugracilis]